MTLTFIHVFTNWRYFLLSVFIFFTVLLFSIWLPNINFIRHTTFSQSLTFDQKRGILISSLGAFQTNFTAFSQILTIIVAVLFAINFSIVVYYFIQRVSLYKASGMSLVGIVIGLLGVGCASCGSVLLSSIFGFGVTASFLGVFPLKGKEFGLLSIVILSISTYLVAKKIQDPLFCNIPRQKKRKANL